MDNEAMKNEIQTLKCFAFPFFVSQKFDDFISSFQKCQMSGYRHLEPFQVKIFLISFGNASPEKRINRVKVVKKRTKRHILYKGENDNKDLIRPLLR